MSLSTEAPPVKDTVFGVAQTSTEQSEDAF